MNLNISPSPFTIEQKTNEDIEQNPFSCQFLYNSMQDHTAGYSCDHQLYQPQHHHHHHQQVIPFDGSAPGCNGGYHVPDRIHVNKEEADYNPVKWVPSKIGLMQKKTKNSVPNHVTLKIYSSVINKIEDQKIQESYSLETDLSSSISYNIPIRVCSDCNTTKTPLWRSGPKGPKSLCNACGIRQRKARRAAMAAASASANGMAVVSVDEPPSTKVIKVKDKEKINKKGNASKFKKHCKMAAAAAAGSSSNGDTRKKLDLEDFLINLSKNLAFQLRVFPQDEKDAAILLMALSSGLVHG